MIQFLAYMYIYAIGIALITGLVWLCYSYKGK
ncbi:MAG: hypothetical protein ACD_33C00045G0027 [uncultured bacterium]|nr:MAG: hypothetical protein ACD_33C00045G0027 [uncultured bacterium]